MFIFFTGNLRKIKLFLNIVSLGFQMYNIKIPSNIFRYNPLNAYFQD